MNKLLTSTALSILLVSLASVCSAQVTSSEREALIALYNSTNGINWKVNTGWLGAAGTECNWYGINCSSLSGSVVKITLHDNALSGSIPSELGKLINLTHLFLNDNSLSGDIPVELGNLAKLTLLFLHNNSLTGSIPVELGNLTKLTLLFLGDNFLTGPLPQWLSDMGIANLIVTDAFGWPSPYNGVTPDSSLGLAFNNIGVFSASDSMIYTCLRIFTDGLPGSAGGISEFDIGLTVVSLDEATVQITKYREFNTSGGLNENAELPDCSGKFETTTSVYTDIIEAGDSVLDTTWSLIDPTNLILKLSSYQELTAD